MDDKMKKSLNEESNKAFLYQLKKKKKKILQTYSWNSTLIETILELKLFVGNTQQNDCLNLFGYLCFYTTNVKNAMQFEKSIFHRIT